MPPDSAREDLLAELESYIDGFAEIKTALEDGKLSTVSATSSMTERVVQLLQSLARVKRAAIQLDELETSERFAQLAELSKQLRLSIRGNDVFEDDSQETVDLMRLLGATWDDVAHSAGTSRQTAHYRFAKSSGRHAESE